MREFTAYFIGEDGHIVNRVDLLCAGENEAKVAAAELAVKFDVELWERARRIEMFSCQSNRNP
jgi:hypothetical protein